MFQNNKSLNERKAKIENQKLSEIQEKYYKKIYDISVIFTLVYYMEKNLPNYEIQNEEIKISDNFSGGFTTIISTEEIVKSSEDGTLYATNHYQAYVAAVSAFEVLIDDLINLFEIPEKNYKKNFSSTFYQENKSYLNKDILKNQIIRKIISIHESLGIESVILRSKELNIYYYLLKLRNKIVHQDGNITNPIDISDYYDLIVDEKITFSKNKFDDVLHRFMIPLKGLFCALDENLSEAITKY